MILTNNEIYELTSKLVQNFNSTEQYIPIKLNFVINKNIQILKGYFEEIEKARFNIGKQYGVQEEDGYSILPENFSAAAKELEDLGKIEQDVQFLKVNINLLDDNIKLTAPQMNAIMFMIDEEF